MSKLLFSIGFLLPLPVYFNDKIAELSQNLGGSLWDAFLNFGFIAYPVYLAIFFLPLFVIISLVVSKSRPENNFKNIFLKLFYGFLTSSFIFILFAFIAISQFQFGF